MTKNEERMMRTIKNLKWQIEDIRRNVNAAVVDYANEHNHEAQKEMRLAIDGLDSISKVQLQSVVYDVQ